MKIGFLGLEYFHYFEKGSHLSPTTWHGGFGYLTRKKCEFLAKMGHEVHAFVPAPLFTRHEPNTRDLESNGVQVHLYRFAYQYPDIPMNYLTNLGKLAQSVTGISGLTKSLSHNKVDVLQSEEPGFYSVEAAKNHSNYVIVFQDPFDESDDAAISRANREYFRIDGHDANREIPWATRQLGRAFGRLGHISSTMNKRALVSFLRGASRVNIFAEAHFIGEKAKRIYGLSYVPRYLPNPQDFPAQLPEKSSHPTILWIGRWDAQKRPDIALQVARQLPNLDFFFVGTASDIGRYRAVQSRLRQEYSKYKNIHLLDFISEQEKSKLLRQSWILFNTSAREGLPMTFLEAGANGLAIVSSVDPDLYATMFGRYVSDGDFARAIKEAVREEWFKDKGRKAFGYMKAIHETSKVMATHLEIYNEILAKGRISRHVS